jgi:hypothetical protein
MRDSKYQQNHFKKRRAQHSESRARCLPSAADCPIKKRYGVTADQLESLLAAQQDACACCDKQLGRPFHIDRRADGTIGLLCIPCSERIASLRHVRRHADAFEAHFKQYGTPAQLSLFYETMHIMGWRPAQSETGRS